MKTPKGVPKKYPSDVADAVAKAIEKDRAELDVADPLQRVGGVLAAIAPHTAARIRRLVGVDRFAEQLADAQKDKR
jgi:hypothetical protein